MWYAQQRLRLACLSALLRMVIIRRCDALQFCVFALHHRAPCLIHVSIIHVSNAAPPGRNATHTMRISMTRTYSWTLTRFFTRSGFAAMYIFFAVFSGRVQTMVSLGFRFGEWLGRELRPEEAGHRFSYSRESILLRNEVVYSMRSECCL